MSKWAALLSQVAPGWKLGSPVGPGDIAAAEQSLGIDLSDDLKSLMLEGDGVVGGYELAVVWPLQRIVEDNLHFRRNFRDLYMPFDNLLFFGDAGNGDQYCHPILANGELRAWNTFCWDHESDNRYWVAGGIKDYIKRLANGSLDE